MRRRVGNHRRLCLTLLSLMMILVSSCGREAVYEEHHDIPEAGWNKDSAVSFAVEILDTTASYEVYLYLRNNHAYPYRNIYFFRSVDSERGTEFADTAEYTMADPYGKWLGKGAGSIKTHEWPFRTSRVQFNQSGTYIFNIQHAMRTDQLLGLESVGLGVYKAENTEEK